MIRPFQPHLATCCVLDDNEMHNTERDGANLLSGAQITITQIIKAEGHFQDQEQGFQITWVPTCENFAYIIYVESLKLSPR